MAAAEARNQWQRSANIYAHEDQTEASSFSYPSSSSLNSLSSESNYSPEKASKEPHDIIPDYLSLFPSSNSPRGRRWWLNQEPDKNIMLTHLSSEFSNESNGNCFYPHIGGDPQAKIHGLKAVNCGDSRDVWFLEDHMMMDLNSPSSEESEKLASDFERHYRKTEPWWRSSGKEDLASLVAQKSLGNIENCDLPRPQAKTYSKQPPVFSKSLDRNDTLNFSMDRMGNKTTGLSDLKGSSPLDSEKAFSRHSEEKGAEPSSESSESKAQLMRALCLSQKRAREAEDAAEQAYTEKEHTITLLLRQASQLLAYKQWLLLLQLENPVLPWMPCKARQPKKGRVRGGSGSGSGRKSKKTRDGIGKFAVAFALGLGLAGAGLLLGWTMGWLFPIA